MESEARLYDFELTRFLHANRYPSSGQARGHASLLHSSSLLDQGRSALTVLRSVKTVKRQDGDYFAQAVEDGDAYPFTSQIGHFSEHMAGQDGSVTKGVFEVFQRGLDGSRFVIRQICDEVTATLHDNRMPRFGNRSCFEKCVLERTDRQPADKEEGPPKRDRLFFGRMDTYSSGQLLLLVFCPFLRLSCALRLPRVATASSRYEDGGAACPQRATERRWKTTGTAIPERSEWYSGMAPDRPKGGTRAILPRGEPLLLSPPPETSRTEWLSASFHGRSGGVLCGATEGSAYRSTRVLCPLWPSAEPLLKGWVIYRSSSAP